MGCIGSIAAGITALTLAGAEPIVIGTEAPFPPWTYIDADGEITGFERDLGDEVCARLAVECVWVNTTFDQLIPGVIAGDFDIIMGGIAITSERRKIISFSIPYDAPSDDADFVGKPGAPDPDHARIGVQSGTIYDAHLGQTGRNLTRFTSEKLVIESLLSGKVDLAFGISSYALAEVEQQGFETLFSEPVPDQGTALAVCKGNEALLHEIDAALAAIESDGLLAAFFLRWM